MYMAILLFILLIPSFLIALAFLWTVSVVVYCIITGSETGATHAD